ncbi:hypothetical protein ACROYT_G032892 [Oculina patagonica]
MKSQKELDDKKKAKTALKEKKGDIGEKKPSKQGESVVTPSSEKDLKKIKYYYPKKITNAVKNNFRTHLTKSDEIQKLIDAPSFHGLTRDRVTLGKEWDKLLSKRIEEINEEVDKNEEEINEEVDKNEEEINEEVDKNDEEINEEVDKNEEEINEEVDKNEGEINKEVDKNDEEINEEVDKSAADSLFDLLKKNFGIELLVSHMPLYGYMYSEEPFKVYFWDGNADAVGWYYNNARKRYEYAIVDWKVLDLLEYWDQSFACGKHLHQCLVYARLLQLHMKLDYLPSILIVPISNNNGKDIHPGFFWDYPEECIRAIKGFLWSIEQPAKPPKKIIWSKDLFSETLEESDLDEEELLTEEKCLKDLFAEGAKVKDLLKALDYNGLKLIKPRKTKT